MLELAIPALIIPKAVSLIKASGLVKAMLPGLIPIFNTGGITLTSIGTNTNTTGATITLTGVNVPAGAMIFVFVAEFTNGSGGSLADGTNTYTLLSTLLPNGTAATHGFGTTWFSANVAALSGATITYTKSVSGAICGITAFYATKLLASPSDAAVTATATGSSTTPSVTSGTPGQAKELFVGVMFSGDNSAFTTFNQDTGNGWSVPPTGVATSAGSNDIMLYGGTQVNLVGTGTKTFSPTLGAARAWAAGVYGFKGA